MLATLVTAVLAAFGTANASPAQGGAMDAVTVPDAPSCARCTIAVRSGVILGAAEGPGSISVGIRAVRVDARGRYWVVAGDEPPLVFDSAGRFVTAVGRTGKGPGEFIRPRDAVPVPGDSVVVIDGGNMRAVVVGPDLRPARAIALPYPFAPLVVAEWPRIVIGNGALATPAGNGWPLHRLSLDGRVADVLGSFGPDSGAVAPGAFAKISQQLAPSSGGGFWSAHYLRYQVTLWTPAGTKGQEFERRPSWFARPSDLEIGRPDRPPDPAISAIADDGRGLVWVFVRTPAPTWREAWPRAGERGEVDYRSIAYEKLFHTTIEVLDLHARRVVARQDVNAWIVSALPGGRAAIYTTDGNDVPRVRIVMLELSGR